MWFNKLHPRNRNLAQFLLHQNYLEFKMMLRQHTTQAIPLAYKSLRLVIAAVLSVQFIGCSFQEYAPKPIDTAQNAARFDSKSFEDSQFQQFLIAQGYAAERLPIKLWHLEDLTSVSYTHLDVYKRQL